MKKYSVLLILIVAMPAYGMGGNEPKGIRAQLVQIKAKELATQRAAREAEAQKAAQEAAKKVRTAPKSHRRIPSDASNAMFALHEGWEE